MYLELLSCDESRPLQLKNGNWHTLFILKQAKETAVGN